MMEKLLERAEELARAAQDQKIETLAQQIATSLPRAETQRLLGGLSVRDVLLMDRWLSDPDLRFAGRAR